MTKRQIMENIPFKLLAIFLLLAAGIITGGILLNSRLSRKAQLDAENDLSAIADLKVQQIVLWRNDRMLEADIFAQSPFFTRAVSNLLSNPGDSRLKKQIYDRLMVQQKSDYWHDLTLLDKKSRVVVETGAMPNAVGSVSPELLEKAKKQNEPLMTDFYFCNICQKVHLDIIVPLFLLEREIKTKDDFIGYVILRLDPHVFLYPLVQSWPVPSKSSETLLIKKDGQDVLFLNELRFRKNTALKYRLPQSQAYFPAAAAVAGSSGVFKGVDYRGVKVLSQLRIIPGTNWYLVTKIDQDEVFADLKRQGMLLILVMIVTVLFAGALVLALFLAQRREHYKKQLQTELDKQALIKHFDYLTKYANDIMLLSDESFRLMEVNDRGIEAYGYSREELLGMNAMELWPEDRQDSFGPQMEEVALKGGLIYEARHVRKDGSTFPVEVSARTIEIEGKKYLQGIVRDISERKQYELDIQERNEELEASNQELMAAEEELRQANEHLESNYAELEAANQQLVASEEGIKQANEKLKAQLSELQRWQNTMLDREDRVMGLKEEINQLLEKFGQPKRYGK